jgi:hypothetical protein
MLKKGLPVTNTLAYLSEASAKKLEGNIAMINGANAKANFIQTRKN